VLEVDVRPASAATAAATSEASTAAATESPATAAAKSRTATAKGGALSATREPPCAGATGRGPEMRGARASSMRHTAGGPRLSSGTRAVLHLAIAGRSAGSRLPVGRALGGALTAVADVRTIGAGPYSLPVSTWPLIDVAKPLLKVRIVVARALPMPCVVLPVLNARTAID